MTEPRGVMRSLRSQRGSAAVVALFALLALSILGLSLLTVASNDFTIARNWRDYTQALYAADAGAEAGASSLRALVQTSPAPQDADLAGIAAPALSDRNLRFSSFQVRRQRTAPPYAYSTTLASGPFAGLSALVTDYVVTATVVNAASSASSTVNQGLQYVQVPLFQFGVFYGKGVDLEMAPGQAMTMNGRVHSNSNIYMGADTGGSLAFNSYITTSGKVWRKIKRDSLYPWHNDPTILDPNNVSHALNFDHDYQAGFTQKWSGDGWKNQALSVFGGRLKDSAMGITDIVPPIPELFQNPDNPDQVAHELIEMPKAGDSAALSAAKLYSQAGLRIVDGVATDKSGRPVTLPVGTLATKSFYDKREGKTMTVTEVNIAVLGATAPANGLLYVGSTTGNAVRLVNGSKLPNQGLTVVSQNPVYVQGDYNTKDTNGNLRTDSTPVANQIPAAILADAITVLSNNWGPNNSDTKGANATSTRPASDTTVNAAFATGPSAESTSGTGNGQLENLIRFLEDWSGGKSLHYKGSLVALWHSQQVTGAWNGTYYSPPRRDWAYDTLFNTTPPPGTPSGVITQKGAWWRQ
jgi:Tfp pilus assembly protein PilX